MSASLRSRRRPTDAMREGDRRAASIALALGGELRSTRKRLRLTQQELAGRVGIDQTRVSQIELGRGLGVPLDVWVALGVALDRPLSIAFSRPLGESREPADAGHLAMQERLLELARATGRAATFELPTRPQDPRRSIDVCVRDDRHRVLVIQEAWNSFGDLGAASRSTSRKIAEAAELAVIAGGDRPYRVAAVWVLRTSAVNRALVARYPSILRAAFAGSSRRWVVALASGAAPPRDAGLVWLDPVTGRVTELRLRAWSPDELRLRPGRPDGARLVGPESSHLTELAAP